MMLQSSTSIVITITTTAAMVERETRVLGGEFCNEEGQSATAN